MTRIIKDGLHYPIEAFRSFHPEVHGTPSPAVLARYGWQILQYDPEPETAPDQVAERGPVEYRDDVPYWTWTIRDKTLEELAQALMQHAQSVKAECRRRILAVCNEAAQTNITQAGLLYSAMRLNGMSDEDALTHAGLISGDLTRATAFQNWRGAMVSNCRAYADDVSLDYLSDDAWPDVPDGVRELAARF